MPLYVYQCRECNATFELLRPASEADAPVMCDCGKARPCERVFASFSVSQGLPEKEAPASRKPHHHHHSGCGCGCSGESCDW